MASFLNANLPSDDEEDDDYAPSEAPQPKRSRPGYRSRPGVADAVEEPAPTNDDADIDEHDPKRLAKKAKVDDLWQKLNSGASAAKVGAASASTVKPLNLAQLCKPADKSKSRADTMWMKSLGILPKPAANLERPLNSASISQQPEQHPQTSQPGAPSTSQPDAKSAAAAALAAARAATGSTSSTSGANKVMVTETRKFAGQDIQVTRQVDKDSKEAQAAAEKQKPSTSGLDAMLAAIEKKKKVNVLDKSKMDWQDYKKSDAAVDEELETYKKSGDKYLDKVDFLQRTELREYERERDQRLASDVRTRGRL